ncbi:MAG TPA: cytochrome c-type biogenesis CcmF C-terminal domain-containing protein, partial [Solirubrobacteraceae bacterium]|nr:cytochrome c-type biogenesis CcmF C-terminal domain-containing protein [Solirubrobacteraceae bacterium]
MATVGRACLLLALAVCAYGIAASLHGARTGRRDWVDSGRRAVYGLALLTTAAFAILEVAFLRSDFSYTVVATHSSTTTPTFYRFAAAWSSQEGSLLLWVWLLSVWSSLVLFLVRRRLRDVAPYATAVLLGFGAFFAGLLVFAASPFETLATAPAEGSGLNPLLRHPSMMIHPPMLYSGYTLFAVPFAFAVGALVVRRIDAEWITATRRFALAAWFFLGIGILLGARWSYAELGWGGYWAWDPVENASLLPWLTGTAFVHSIMIQEKRGMLKVWNASLVLTTGILAVLGTFLVRSGILDSIHAFGASTLGVPFVTLIALMIGGSVALVVTRRDRLRSEHQLDSLLSREAVFLGNNLVLVGLAFVVFWGTFFPLISEAVTGTRSAVGPPWFDRYTVPLALVLVLLSGIGPVIAWRRATWASVRRAFLVPGAAAATTLVVLVAAGVTASVTALLMFVVATFTVVVVVQELWRGTVARRAMSGEPPPRALVSLVRRNRRRYGGYIVHLGMAVLFVGVAASSAFQHARDVRLAPGQTARVGGYDVRYVRPTAAVVQPGRRVEKVTLGAILDVSRKGRHVATLRTERGYYPAQAPSGTLVRA